MLLGHLPAGYVATETALRWGILSPSRAVSRRAILAAGLLGSVLPDVDILYFYLIDDRQHLHHGYWTHIPSFWAVVFLGLYGLAAGRRSTWMKTTLIAAGANVLLHLGLDTITGKVRWLAPFSSRDFVLFDVPARYSWWVWNFVFHWTFVLEILVLLVAAAMLWRARRAEH